MDRGELIPIRQSAGQEVPKETQLEMVLNMLFQCVDLETVDMSSLDAILNNCDTAVEQFTTFLNAFRRVTDNEDEPLRSSFIDIDRKHPFDPVEFMHHRGLEISEQDDELQVKSILDSSQFEC